MPVAMTGRAQAVEALLDEGEVVCSRCRERMHPEIVFHKDYKGQSLLMWRCQNGHATTTLPVPKAFPLVEPYLG